MKDDNLADVSVGTDYKNTRPNDDKQNVYETEIWNAAIEAAFKWLNEEANWQTWNDPKDAEKIRSLKK